MQYGAVRRSEIGQQFGAFKLNETDNGGAWLGNYHPRFFCFDVLKIGNDGKFRAEAHVKKGFNSQ